jgi:RNA polymerase sigma-70 factor (ECF subfamily)
LLPATRTVTIGGVDPSRYTSPNQVDTTSTRLLRQAGTGDAAAWRTLVEVYGPVVRFWVRRAGLNRTDQADVFQDVFLAVSRNIDHFERAAGAAKFRAWLKTVTQSQLANHFRRREHEAAPLGGTTAMLRLNQVADEPRAADRTSGNDEVDGADRDPAMAGSEDSFVARRMLEALRAEFEDHAWQAFYRTAVDGLTSRQVAAELGSTPIAVRKAKSRVLARLRAALGESSGNGSRGSEMT